MKKLVILGAGGYGQTIADIAEQTGEYIAIAYLDDHSDKAIDTCNNFEKYLGKEIDFYPAFGNNEMRMNWIHRLLGLGCNVPTIIHPKAYVSSRATLLPGTMVLPFAVVNTSCIVKAGCIINCGAIVDHGCVLEEGIHVSPGAVVKAENHLPALMKVESGTVIQNRQFV